MSAIRVYIAGMRHAGKDTAADALCAACGTVSKIKLTDPVYALAAARGMRGKDRAMLQQTGDYLRTVYGEDVLANHVILRSFAGDWVCADVRLPREAEILRREGWIGLRIVRPEEERMASLAAAGEQLDGPEATHRTETSIERVPVDAVILNGGSVEDLARRVEGTVFILTSAPSMDEISDIAPWWTGEMSTDEYVHYARMER